jgi:hypothetical protein
MEFGVLYGDGRIGSPVRPLVGYAHALGVDGYAAVPRVCLGQTTPPLCRYAVHTKRKGGEHGGYAEVEHSPQ